MSEMGQYLNLLLLDHLRNIEPDRPSHLMNCVDWHILLRLYLLKVRHESGVSPDHIGLKVRGPSELDDAAQLLLLVGGHLLSLS